MVKRKSEENDVESLVTVKDTIYPRNPLTLEEMSQTRRSRNRFHSCPFSKDREERGTWQSKPQC